jgi:hypothetical protein
MGTEQWWNDDYQRKTEEKYYFLLRATAVLNGTLIFVFICLITTRFGLIWPSSGVQTHAKIVALSSYNVT